MRRSGILVLLLLLPALACSPQGQGRKLARTEPAPVQVGAENAVTVRRDEVISGPIVSGELRAERQATVRAELTGPMTQVAVEEGEAVRQGTLLGRIRATQLDEARRSAESAVRSAENQLANARRETARTRSLVEAGALAVRDLESARNSLATAEAQLADARSRLAAADKELANTVLRSPIAGIVSDSAVNQGDVVSPGTPLFTIIDPASMRLEASVPSSAVGDLRLGARVRFTVRGYDRTFEGVIQRINPQADPVTRQVSIYVSIPNTERRLVAGLFAEGRVVSRSARGLVAPANAVSDEGDTPWVLRVRDGKAERVEVKVGLRDEHSERVLISQGVSAGDVLLRGPAQGITPGTPVRVGAAATANPASPAASSRE